MAANPQSVLRSFRWTSQMAGEEFRRDHRAIRKRLRELNIRPGPDGKFSTYDMLRAVNPLTQLEREAKEAKLHQQIDEAEVAKLEREQVAGRLVNASVMREFCTD